MRHSIFCLALVALASVGGCARSSFQPYVGRQQQWPVSAGAIVETNAPLPIYYGWPDRPYYVLGTLDCAVAPLRAGGILRYAARQARQHGADAAVILTQGSTIVGYHHTRSYTTPQRNATATVLLIQFRPDR